MGKFPFSLNCYKETVSGPIALGKREIAKNTNTHERANRLHVRFETAAIAEKLLLDRSNFSQIDLLSRPHIEEVSAPKMTRSTGSCRVALNEFDQDCATPGLKLLDDFCNACLESLPVTID